MEKDYNLMMKCRAIFVRTIAVMLDGDYAYDGRFELLLKYFFFSFVYIIPDYFELIYDVRIDENNNKYIYEDDNMRKMFFKYLLDSNSNDRLGIMCDDVGIEKVSIISELAELFCEYVVTIDEIRSDKIRILN